MGDLLFLVGRPAAEVREQLLPACFVFGLDDKINKHRHQRTLYNYAVNVLIIFSILVLYTFHMKICSILTL